MSNAFAKRIKEGRTRAATIIVDMPPAAQVEVIAPCASLQEFDEAMARFETELNVAKQKAREWIAFGHSA